MHYLYKITNILNGKIYIGQTIEINRRWQAHKSYAKNPEKTGQYVHRAMGKHGINNFSFEVIATCCSVEDANEIETLLIQQYDSRNPQKGYNIKSGGQTWDDEMRQHMSEKIKQHYQNHPEDRERVSNQAKMLWKNPEHIVKMKTISRPNKMKGKKISEEQRTAILIGIDFRKGRTRKPLSEEHKASISNTKRNESEEIKRDRTNRIILARGQVILTDEQKQAIINDPRSSYILAQEYNVNASTIQRIRKKALNESKA